MNFLCLLCHEAAQKKLALCKACEKILPYTPSRFNEYTPFFDKAVVSFDYLFPIDHLITQLKFQHRLINATLLGELLSQKIKSSYAEGPLPSLLIPVPLHLKRLRERGFNQALEICKVISKKLYIPLDKSSCYRTRYTAQQTALSQPERLKNLKGAFALKKPLHAVHIALIDDVITTGQTLKELAALLRHQGIDRIDVWCCAKTPIKKI